MATGQWTSHPSDSRAFPPHRAGNSVGHQASPSDRPSPIEVAERTRAPLVVARRRLDLESGLLARLERLRARDDATFLSARAGSRTSCLTSERTLGSTPSSRRWQIHELRYLRLSRCRTTPNALRRHLQMNSASNVDLVSVAVAGSDGQGQLFHLEGAHPCSTSLVRDFMGSQSDVRSSVVPTVALDSFLEARGAPSVALVKLDIETGEPDALRGMCETLERDRPSIFCEVLSTDVGASLRTILAPLDYRFYHLTAGGPVERSEIVAHPEWLNYLFTVMPPDRVRALHLDSRGRD